ncbi:GntR family transcriptional regulator [Vibrio paucivorans]
MTDWNDSVPIFRQLAERLTEQILRGVWLEEQALPSVRAVAADLKINHLTVMKGYQLLVDEGVIEKKRGQGMFVAKGALATLKASRRKAFMDQQIPKIANSMQQLDISLEEFLEQLTTQMKGEK